MILRRDRIATNNDLSRALSVTAKRRRLRTELLEERRLLAVGPQLLGIDHNNGVLIQDQSIHDTAPRELTFRFDEGQVLDPDTFGAFRLVRSGDDGVFDNGNDVEINPGFLDLGQTSYTVVMRFSQTLPDDLYRIEIAGTGPNALRNVDGGALGDTTDDGSDNGKNFSRTFDLQLGAQVISVVPQPVTRNPVTGALSQAKDTIEVYFNNDTLDGAKASTPAFYRLIDTEDQSLLFPASVVYDASANKATLTFPSDLSMATYQLQIGATEESNGTAGSAVDLGTINQQATAATYESPVRNDADGNPIPTPIADNGTVISAITVVDSFLISDVNVELNIDHQWGPDLRIFLQAPGGQRVELIRDLGSQVRGGQIYGVKYDDLNENGQRDADEPGLPGWTIFIDSNANGVLDPGERSTVTDSEGRYSFLNLDLGRSYQLVEVPQTFWQSTEPASSVATSLFATDFSNGAVQTLTIVDTAANPVTKGTFRLGFSGRTTLPIEFAGTGNASTTAANIQESLEPLLDPGIAVRVVAVSGKEFTISFRVNGVGTPVDHPALLVVNNQLDAGQLQISNAGDSSGFTSVGTNNLWHLSTGRGNALGHTPQHSFYFGQNETDVGGGSYVNNANGTLRSPEIDLSDPAITGPVTLRLNHLLSSESGFDFAEIRVVADEQETVLLRTSGSTGGFAALQFDLTPFLGRRIRLDFNFQSDFSVVGEGWYVDDIRIELQRPAQSVALDTSPQQQVASNVNFGSSRDAVVGPDAFGYRAFNVSTEFEDISANESAQRILQAFTGTGYALQLGGAGDEVISGIARDAAGNIYLAGSFQGTVDFDLGPGTSTMTSVGGNDIFVAKYDADGALLWARQAGGASSDVATSVAVDSTGNVVVSGSFSQTANFGGTNLTSNGSIDAFVWKLDAAGSSLWARGVGGSAIDEATGIAVMANGDVVASGYFSGTVDFDPGAGIQNQVSAGGTDIFVLRLDAAGNFAWVRRMGGTGADRAESIHVTAAGNITTTGSFSTTVDFNPGGGTSNLTSSGSTDGFVQQLNSAGNFRWAQRFGAATADRGNDVTSDASGNVFVTGVSNGDVFVRRLTATGGTTWTRTFGGGSTDIGEAIDVAADGSIAVAGSFRSTVNFGGGNRISAGGSDAFVLRLNTQGNYNSVATFGGTLDDIARGVVVQDAASFLLAGTFRGTATFDVGSSVENLTAAGGSDGFLVKVATPTGVDDAAVEISQADLNGFQFEFYGTVYDSLFVSSNGLITFGAANDSSANTDLLDMPSQATIAAFWEDLRTGAAEAEAVFWEVLGSDGNQRLVVQWNNVQVDNLNSAAIGPLDFQAVLYERDGSIQLNYRSVADPQAIPAGPEQAVGTFTKGVQVAPAIASDAAGNYVVVWESFAQDGDQESIYARRYDAAGNALGGEIQINQTTSGRQWLPRVAMNASGRFVVTWLGNGPGDADGVFARIFNAAGNPVSDEILVNASTSGAQDQDYVAIDDAGNFIVAWQGAGPEDNDGILVRRFNSNGQPRDTVDEIQRLRFLGPPTGGSSFTLIHNGVQTGSIGFAGGANGANTTAANIRDALRGLPNTGNMIDVIALPNTNEVQTLTFTGDPASGDFTLGFGALTTGPITFAGAGMGAATAGNIQTELEALASIGAGNVAVAQVGTSDFEFTVTFIGTLAAANQPNLVLNTNNLNQGSLSISETTQGSTSGRDFEVRFLGPDGATNQPLLALGSTQGGVTHMEVVTQRDGSSGEIRVNNQINDLQARPRLDVTPTGEFIVSWESNGQDGSGLGVFGKRFDASATPIEEEFDELQKITLNGPPNAGSRFSLRVGNATTGLIDYVGANSGARTAANIQGALNALPGLGGVTVTAGVGVSNEIQEIIFSRGLNNTPGSGTFRLAHRGLITAPIVFAGQTSANAQATATNIENALRALANTGDQLTVVAAPVPFPVGDFDPYRYIVTFLGPDGGLDHPALVPTDNQLNLGSLSVGTIDDGGKSENEFFVSFGGTAGRQDHPDIELINNSFGVTSITTEELVRGVSSEFQVNAETTNDQRNGDIAFRDDGSFLSVWQSTQQDGDGEGVYGKLFAANGDVLRDEFQVNTFTQSNQQRPRVDVDPAGNFVVTWVSLGQDGSGLGVFARRFGADGFALGDEFAVNTITAGNQDSSAITVRADGTFVIAWDSEAGGGGIQSQHFAPDRTKVGDEVQVSQFGVRDQDTPEIARADNGNYVIVWQESGRDVDNSSGIYGQLFDAAGVALSGEFQVASTAESEQFSPSISMDAAGNFVVVWVHEELDAEGNSTLSARGRRFDSTGTAQGDEFTIAATDVGAVDVSVNRSTGDFVAIWLAVPEGGNLSIQAKIYDSNGIAQTADLDLIVSDNDNNPIMSSFPPQVAMDNSGAFGVTWTTLNLSSFLYEVNVGRWDAAGNLTADSVVAGTRPVADFGFDYYRPDIAVNSLGELNVVWQSFDFNNNNTFEDVLLRRFDTDLLPLSDIIRVNQDSTSTNTELFPRIAQAPDDSFVITWQDEGRANGILAQRFDESGAFIGGNVPVINSSSTQFFPAVVAGDGGEFRIAFLDDRVGLGVFTRAFTTDLASVGIKDAGVQSAGENVLQIWVDGTRTSLVGQNTSTRIAILEQPLGRLFAVDAGNDRLLELNSQTGATLKSYPLPAAAGTDAGLAYAGGTVFYLPGNGSALYELHPDTGGTVDVIPLSDISTGGLAGLAYLNGEVVLLDATAGELIFIDPFRNLEVRRVAPAVSLAGGLVGGGSRGTLFAINAASEIVELDPANGTVVATLASPGANLVGLALVDGVLLASDSAGAVYQIAPETGTVSGTLTVAAGLAALGADGGGSVQTAAGGDYQPFVGTILDDEASVSITEGTGPYTGRFRPIEPLSTFDGTNARGSWRLEIQDTASGNTGVLHNWRLLINEAQDTPADVSHMGFIGDNFGAAAVAANDVDVYRFAVQSGGTISVDGLPDAGLDMAIRLFDSQGNPLALVDAAGVGGAERLDHVVANAGTYFVAISSAGNVGYNISDGSGAAGGTTTGSYELGISFSEPLPQEDDNSSFGTATPIGDIGVGGQRIRAEIRSAPFTLEMPGAISEPGHRDIPPESHLLSGGASQVNPGHVLLSFKDGIEPSRQAAILSAQGLELVKSFDFIGAMLVKTQQGTDLTAKLIQLRNLPEVRYADPDSIKQTQVVPNDPEFVNMWHLNNVGQTGGLVGADINMTAAWDTFTGSAQTVIAVLDTGVDYNHPDLAANMWINPGEIPGDGIDNDGNGYIDDVYGIDTGSGDSDPMDVDGHGTHVAGTTSAVGNNGIGVSGVNWNAKIMALKIFPDVGGAPSSAIIEALNYLVTMKTTYGINIVVSNNSYGGLGSGQAERDAIEASINVGVPFVAAAGNFALDNDLTPFYPASYDLDGIISVAASDHNDRLAGFSHVGLTSVDIAAPGAGVLSTIPGGGYANFSGTSMASPHVAGVVALMAGHRPGATVGQLKAGIMLGGDPLSSMIGTSVSGARLNAAQALSLIELNFPAAGPSAVTTVLYNFQDIYGFLPSGAEARNSITEIQKQRAREIFEIYSQLMGLQFIETEDEGLTIVTGDLRVLNPTVEGGPGGVAGISDGSLSGTAIMDAGENWGDSEYGGAWFTTAMHEIGHNLGLGHSYDLPDLTIMGGFGTGEPVFPGDHDIVHGRYVRPPASIDQDLYHFTLTEDGWLTAETIAERIAPNASLLDTQISLYRETAPGRRVLVARNDDYYSNDSFLRLHLARGTYYIAVSAANNKGMDPTISDTGFGGTSQGDYELRLDFEPDARNQLTDLDGVALDGDADGTPGGVFRFNFESGPTIFVDKLADVTGGIDGDGSLASPLDNIQAATELARQTLVMPRGGGSDVADGESFLVSDGLNPAVIFEFDNDGRVAMGSIAISYSETDTADQLAAAVAATIVEATSRTPTILNVGVAASSGLVRLSGTSNIDASDSPSLMKSVSIVRIVGNGGADGDVNTLGDNRPYLLGFDGTTRLADGGSLEVPQGVTVMVDAGALFKLREANFDVGSSVEDVDRSRGALQILGTPAATVSFYSYRNDTVGGDSDGPGTAPAPGDWGGLVFRADSDMEAQGVFLNWVNHATLVSGGGKLLVESVESTFTPIHLLGSRPAITHNVIRRSADAAMSADPASFEDSLGRVGPDIHGNLIVENSLNGLFINIRTALGESIDRITLPSRWDDTDIVHILTENLLVEATPGGPIKDPATGVIQARFDGSLKIDPGMVVKLEGSRIEALIGGQIIAEGTKANPIIFTSLTDDSFGGSGSFDTKNDGSATLPAAGQWGGLIFNAMAEGSLDHVLVAHAGGLTTIDGGFDQFNAIEIHQAEVRLANSIIRNNAAGTSSTNRNGRGTNAPATVFVRGAQPLIINNIFADNQGTVIHINANALQAVQQPDTGRKTGALERFDQFADNYGPLVRLNRLQNNSFNGMEVRGAVLTTETVWDDTDIAHILRGEVVVLNHHTFSGLHLLSNDRESLVIKLDGPNAGFTANGTPLDIDDRIGGSIYIGAAGLPVVMTSLSDDTAVAGVNLIGQPLGDTDNNGPTQGSPGDWRSIRLEKFSNDRNVGLVRETEPAFSGAVDSNRTPATAQFLGTLAPDEKSGDVNRRLGFEIHGNIAVDHPRDVDVYSFTAVAGTEVFFDIDQTGHALDSILELIDATGTVLARSISNLPEGLSGRAQRLLEHTYLGHDYFTINARDAGMRVVLPGPTGQPGTFFIRVRSNPVAGEVENINGGLSRGEYKLQIRMQQRDEKPGSFINNADIRFATNGIEVIGLPGRSPLIGESAETRAGNDSLGAAQPLGNLLESDRNTISVGGNLTTATDIDWYSFEIDYAFIQSIAGFNNGDKTFATIFDIDYADGLSRADTVLSVFDSNGNLVLVSRDSNIEDDQPGAGQGADTDDLSRGSFGTLDPFIGSVQMPAGGSRTYYVAVSSNSQLPTALNGTFTSGASSSLVRLEPVNSLQRIAEDHIGFHGYTSGNNAGSTRVNPTTPLFDISNSVSLSANVVPFQLKDIVLYTAARGQNGLRIVNPHTGQAWTDISGLPDTNQRRVTDLVMRSDGRLFMYVSLLGQAGQNTAGQLVEIDPGTGAETVIGTDSIPDVDPNANPINLEQLTSNAVEGFAWQRTDVAEYNLWYAVRGARRTTGFDTNSSTLYRADPANGSAAVVMGQPWGRVEEIYADARGDLGVTTGMAFVGNTLYGVSDRGFFYQINTGNGQATRLANYGGIGLSFSGLALGPQNAEGGRFAQTLFATTDNGQIVALDTNGSLQAVFSSGTSASTAGAPVGLAFSPLDFNLWHPTMQRFDDAGHGVNSAFDNSRSTVFRRQINTEGDSRRSDEREGGASFYFGLEPWAQDPEAANAYLQYTTNAQYGILDTAQHRDLSANPRLGNNYDLPGGALGSLQTNTFSLSNSQFADKPTLYFNYFLETEGRDSRETMRDSARVLISRDGGTSWELLATNNSILSTNLDSAELPRFISPSVTASTHPRQQVQELFDNTGGWRQARVDLSNYANEPNLQIRFDFSTAAGLVGNPGGAQGGIDSDISRFDTLDDKVRAQNNAFEGFYIDDIIIGFAERGEMVTNSGAQSQFFTLPPNPEPSDPAQNLVGAYQLEIRRGTEYAANVDELNPDIFVFQTLETNDRLVRELFRLGDSNLHREQGQLVIGNNTVTDSLGFGIRVDAGLRDAGGSLSYPGGVRNLPTLNNDRLVAGVKIENNVVAGFGQGGILFSGDPNTGSLPLAAVPYGRVMNNTIYGGDTASGAGISVTDNASPTVLNNIVANTVSGLTVDASSASSVVGANLFSGNTNNGRIGQNAIVLAAGSPLFVDATNRNFYPAPGSFAVDSSLNSLSDRPSFVAVNSPLGIPPSPILAPDRDRFGQLRLDDPAQDPPPGLGSNIFKDRGAVERSDFQGPTARLVQPLDNDGLGVDLNPLPNEVLVEEAIINQISIQLLDQGIGVDDSSVTVDTIELTLDGVLLTPGTDYEFVYNATNNLIILRALKNNGPVSNTYEILLSSAAGAGIRDLADNALSPNEQSGNTRFVVVTGGEIADQSLPDFTLAMTQIDALEDNEAELGVTITEVANFATDLPPEPALGEPDIVFTTVSVSNAGMFSQLPAIDQEGKLTFHTAPDQNGTSIVVVRLTEVGTSNPRQSAAQTFTITLAPINDAPFFSLPPNLNVLEDAGLVTLTNFAADFGPGPVTATDEVGQALTIETTALDPSAFVVQPTIDSSGTLRFQTRPDFNSSMSEVVVTVAVSDNGPDTPPNVNRSPTKTFTINVEPVNDAPSFTLSQSQLDVVEDRETFLGIAQSEFPGFATNIAVGPPTATDELTQVPSFTLTAARPELFSQQPAMDKNGQLTFRLAPDRSGTTLVVVRMFDSGPSTPPPNQNASGTATFTLSIAPINDPPEFSVPATATALEDAGLVTVPNFATGIRRGPVTAVDEFGQSVSFEVTALDPSAFAIQPTMAADGTLSFRTALNVNSANADDLRVRVRLTDSGASTPPPNNNQSEFQTFTLLIDPVNDPPIPDAFAIAGTEDTDLVIQSADVLVGDLPGPTADETEDIFISQLSQSSEAGGLIVAQTSGDEIVSFTYSPPENFVGADTFLYVVSDRGTPSRSGTGTITVNVAAVNDPPQFERGPNQSVPEDAGAVTVSGWATNIHAGPLSATDELASQTVAFDVTAANPALFEVQPSVDSSGNLRFTPAKDANGQTAVVLFARDDGPSDAPNVNVSPTQSFTINITSVNDPPVFTAGAHVAVEEDSGSYSQPWASNIAPAAGLLTSPPTATDEAGQDVTFELSVDRPELFSVQPTVNSDGQLSFTTAPDAFGDAVIVVTAIDSGPTGTLHDNRSQPATLTVTVQPVNDPPTAVADSYVTDEDTLLSVPAPGLLANDTDVDLPLDTLFAVAGTFESDLGATVVINEDGSMTYDPRSVTQFQQLLTGQSLTDTFTYRVRDEAGAESVLNTVSIQVQGIDDAPVANNDTFSVGVGQGRNLDVLANDSDVDSTIDPSTITVTSNAAFGQVTVNQTGVVRYTPDPGFRGADSFSYTVRDSEGNESNEATVNINVNSAPTATDDNAFTVKGEPVVIDVLANDSDVDGTLDPATVRIEVQPTPTGSLAEVLSDGRIRFTPAPGFAGQTQFSYSVRDNLGTPSNVATVRINVANSKWQNPRNALDVNDDGFVSPIDALLVVNYLNAGENLSLPSSSVVPPPYLDPSGDERVSALDVLLVINFLNESSMGGGSPEGEGDPDFGSMAYVMPITQQQLVAATGQQLARQEHLANSRALESLLDDQQGSPSESALPPASFLEEDEDDDLLSFLRSEHESLAGGVEDAVDAFFSDIDS